MKKLIFCSLIFLACFKPAHSDLPHEILQVSNFSTDIVAHYDQDVYDQNSAVAVAFNGWIYIAFSSGHSGPPGTDINFVISKDSGNTWQPFPATIYGTHNGAAVYDLIVAGTDTNNLRIYLSYYNFSVGFPYSFGGVKVFDGLTGATLPYGRLFGDGTYNIGEVHLASDWNNPASGSNGYSVAIIYSTTSGDSTNTDSLVCLVANDTSLNDYAYYLIDSSSVENIFLPSIGYGHSQSAGNGNFFISYMKAIDVLYCKTISGVTSGFSPAINLNLLTGNPSGSLGYPFVVCQNSDADNDSTGLSVMVMTRALDSITSGTYRLPYILYNMNAASTDNWYGKPVSSTTDISVSTYDVAYSKLQDKFYYTGYNADSSRLFMMSEDFNFSDSSWFTVTEQYNDSVIDPAREPNPRMTCSGEYAYVTWIMDATGAGGMPIAQTMFDKQSLPLLTSTGENSINKSIIYPNPAGNNMMIESKTTIDFLRLYDCMGKMVYGKRGIHNSQFYMDVSSLENGIYTLMIFDENKRSSSQKVVILH